MKRIGLCLIFAAAFAVLAGGCQTWRQEDAPAFGLGMKAVWIPAGSFLMGSPQYEIDRWENEGLQRLVTISEGFWMGAHPVTQQQWTQVMGENPVPGIAALYAPNRPVVMVSWYDALVFANRLSLIEGLVPAYSINGSSNPDDWGPVPANRDAAWDAVQTVPGSTGWRLPTEAQWEYAARAGTVSAFSSGTAD
ncbi:MAG: formylglycine-generating enzyme family protein, partial [Spirochaetes bacterium]|nr:formylglycine-generating enzyme family protein [Spirochaetota bacterium]